MLARKVLGDRFNRKAFARDCGSQAGFGSQACQCRVPLVRIGKTLQGQKIKALSTSAQGRLQAV